MIFLIISVIIFNSIAFFIPKHISRLEIYASSLFAVFLEYVANYIFDFILKLYGYFKPGIDISGFIGVIGVYPAVSIILLNCFPFKSKFLIKLMYILGWSLFSVFYEWMSVKGKYFYHSGWSYWQSLVSYPVIFVAMIFNLKLIRYLIRRGS